MPATSKAQQKLFGIAHAIQKGTMKPSKASDPAKKIAKTVSAKDVKDFASTDTKGLPDRKEALEARLKEVIRKVVMRMHESIIGKKVNIETYDGRKFAGMTGVVIKQLYNGKYVIRMDNGRTVTRDKGEVELKESVIKETPESKKYQQNQMISAARKKAQSDPQAAYAQYKTNVKDPSKVKSYDDWHKTWKEGIDESSKFNKCDICGKPTKENTHGNPKYCQGHSIFDKKKTQTEMVQEKLGRELTVPEKHQLAIAYKTMKMSDAGALVMGGMNRSEAQAIIKKLTGKDYAPKKEGIFSASPEEKYKKAIAKMDELIKKAHEHLSGDSTDLQKAFYRGMLERAQEKKTEFQKKLADASKKESVNEYEGPHPSDAANYWIECPKCKYKTGIESGEFDSQPPHNKILCPKCKTPMKPKDLQYAKKYGWKESVVNEALPEFQCLECGKTYPKPVRKCSKCGSSDIDVYVPPKKESVEEDKSTFKCPHCDTVQPRAGAKRFASFKGTSTPGGSEVTICAKCQGGTKTMKKEASGWRKDKKDGKPVYTAADAHGVCPQCKSKTHTILNATQPTINKCTKCGAQWNPDNWPKFVKESMNEVSDAELISIARRLKAKIDSGKATEDDWEKLSDLNKIVQLMNTKAHKPYKPKVKYVKEGELDEGIKDDFKALAQMVAGKAAQFGKDIKSSFIQLRDNDILTAVNNLTDADLQKLIAIGRKTRHAWYKYMLRVGAIDPDSADPSTLKKHKDHAIQWMGQSMVKDLPQELQHVKRNTQPLAAKLLDYYLENLGKFGKGKRRESIGESTIADRIKAKQEKIKWAKEYIRYNSNAMKVPPQQRMIQNDFHSDAVKRTQERLAQWQKELADLQKKPKSVGEAFGAPITNIGRADLMKLERLITHLWSRNKKLTTDGAMQEFGKLITSLPHSLQDTWKNHDERIRKAIDDILSKLNSGGK